MPPRRRGSAESVDATQGHEVGVAPSKLTVSIYQNPEHVSSILQQAFGAPLLTAESRENLQEQSDSTSRSRSTGAAVGGEGKIPIVGSLTGNLQHDMEKAKSEATSSSGKQVQEFVYSQAYYLHVVKEALRQRGQIVTVTSSDEAEGLKVGDFVEFEAEFRPNEVNSMLDILTPDLVAAIAMYRARLEGRKAYLAADDVSQIQRLAHVYEVRAVQEAELARAIATAVRVDFRSATTREYYGSIGREDEKVIAVTICDVEHFLVADEDRILDGRFTVLGKVTLATESDVPILARNKLLRRFRPEAVDEVFDRLKEVAASPATGGMFDAVGDLVDIELASRVEGPSFKVLPIAIYT